MKHFISELFLLWIETGKKRYTKEETVRATQVTLEGISKKCPDFPVKPLAIPKHIPLYRRTMFRVAAVIVPLLVVGAAIGLLQINVPDSDTLKQQLAKTEGALQHSDKVATITIAAVDDDKLVEMPDGSTIKLEEGARLEYQANFTDKRTVKLNGAAFFKVAKRNGKSFDVNYGEMSVRVLGTEFYVCGYGETTEVTLCTGSVEISSANYNVLLEPHQQFTTDVDGKNYSVVKLSSEDIARVYHGRLKFKDTPLNEALEKTGHFFGVEIDASSVKNTEPVRMKAGMHDKLEDVLYMLKLLSNNAFSYRIDHGQVTINGN